MGISYINMDWSLWYLKLCTCIWWRLTSALKCCFSSTWMPGLSELTAADKCDSLASILVTFGIILSTYPEETNCLLDMHPANTGSTLAPHQQVWTSWSSLTAVKHLPVGDATAAQFISRNGSVRAAEPTGWEIKTAPSVNGRRPAACNYEDHNMQDTWMLQRVSWQPLKSAICIPMAPQWRLHTKRQPPIYKSPEL